MPSADVIVWSGIVGLLAAMLSVIGYLIDKGFTSLKADIKAELQSLWSKFESYQSQCTANEREIAKINERCRLMHRDNNHGVNCQ